MKSKKMGYAFILLMFLPCLTALAANTPILFQMQGVDRSGYGWNNDIWIHSDWGMVQANCKYNSKSCPLYVQMLKNTSITIDISDKFDLHVYCKLDIKNSNDIFEVKLTPIQNTRLTCSLIGDPNSNNFLLRTDKTGILK